MKRLVVVIVALTLAWGLQACADTLSADARGVSVNGVLTYNGTLAASYSDPTWVVLLAAMSPAAPDLSPHAILSVPAIDIYAPFEYSLELIQPYDYFVLAQLVDADAYSTDSPLGIYGGPAMLTAAPPGNVAVGSDDDVVGIDIEIQDPGGVIGDGEGTLEVLISGTTTVFEQGDMLSVAVLAGFSADTQVASVISDVPGLPTTLTISDVPEGSFPIVAVCFDKLGDAQVDESCDGPGDELVTLFSVTIAEGETTQLTAVLP